MLVLPVLAVAVGRAGAVLAALPLASQHIPQFFALARSYTHLDELDRDTLVTFVERIEIGPKIMITSLAGTNM